MQKDDLAGSAIFLVSSGEPVPRGSKRALLGDKALGLLGLAASGAPVPPAFILPGALLAKNGKGGASLPKPLRTALENGLKKLAKLTGRRLGDGKDPLLLSLRTSPRVSASRTQGRSTTEESSEGVVNIGLNLETVAGLLEKSGDGRLAWDGYRRFLDSFGRQVLGVEAAAFDRLLQTALKETGAEADHELDAKAMEALAKACLKECNSLGGRSVPEDPLKQLAQAIAALSRRQREGAAVEGNSRPKSGGLGESAGKSGGGALIVQEMVFGTGAAESGSGHFFTRHPGNGEKRLHGRYLRRAGGTDLSSGVRLPDDIKILEKEFPRLHGKLRKWGDKLERHFQDAQEIQFTVEAGRLALLSSSPASRTARASFRIAVDLEQEGICSEQQALMLIDPCAIELLLHPVLDRGKNGAPIGKGLPASPGSAVGQVVFFAEQVEEMAAQGGKTILVRHQTTPEDIGGFKAAEGILTAHGGLTSHAAVVARGMGKCCVVGVADMDINYHVSEMQLGGVTVKRMDWISLDGTTGEIFLGEFPQVQPSLEGDLAKVLGWADQARTMGVRANADTAEDATRALEMGAEGVGLCRTEHMFFEIDRIPIFRKMILAVDEIGRSAALAELLPMQRKDFMDIFRIMAGRPVTIRLLDPPLHEFLPRGIRSQTRMSRAMNISLEELQRRTEALSENNPMLGHRGCRLAFTYPEIYHMQVRAIVEAACIVAKEGVPVTPEVMVPLVSTASELEKLRAEIHQLAERVMEELAERVEIPIGTMLETPRAAVCSRSIAPFADFFSFGTNDLTQMGFGFSRDDAGSFLPIYLEKNVLESDPFVTLDQEGIGALVRIAIEEGRAGNAGLKIGICGEHGGEPESVKFFHRLGLDYVSCSPFRIPVARVAAAQAALESEEA